MDKYLEVVLELVAIILAVAFVFFMLVVQFSIIENGRLPNFARAFLPGKLKSNYKSHLAKHLTFYNCLGPKSKVKFERKVQQFINMKQFISRGKDMEVTDEMKALIAGTAIMISYGLPNIYLSYFKKILIYETNYYSTITRKYHKGEVNPRGVIVLSWQAFKEGYIDKHDGVNLGIHEMAHALKLENKVRNEEYGFLNHGAIRRFNEIANKEISLRTNDSSIKSRLRDYSITNLQEFFAVASELFFENPEELNDYSSDLYSIMIRIYKLDTLRLYSRPRHGSINKA